MEVFPVGPDIPMEAGSRYMHLCLETENLSQTVDELRRRGVTITREITRGKDESLQAWIRDPDGNEIELMQINPESPRQRRGGNGLRAECYA